MVHKLNALIVYLKHQAK